MSKEIFKIIFEEFKKNGIKLNDFEYRGDTFVSDLLDIVNAPILRGEDEDIRPLLDFSEHDKPFEDKIEKLETLLQKQDEFLDMKNLQIDELKQRIAELEREKSEKPVAYVLAKEIDGQHYVTVEDFMSVVNNLQRQRAD